MRKRFIYFSLLIVLSTCLVNIGQGGEKKCPLKVTIKSDKEVYEVIEPINIELKITNIRDKKITICTRLIGAFLFDIVDSKGEKICSDIIYELRPTTKDDFLILDSNCSYGKIFNLLDEFLIYKPGQYRVTAEKKFALDAWAGTVVSNTIIVTVKKPNEARLLFITQRLKHGNYKTKCSAVRALGEIGDRRAIKPLIDTLLEDEDEQVRRAAAWALGKIGDKSAVPALIKALKDKDSAVRWNAVMALGAIGDKSAVPALIEALKDKDSAVRLNAALVLGEIGDKSAVPALTEALKDEHLGMRWNAVLALGEIGDRRAIKPLIDTLLEDEDEQVRRTAAWALGKIGDKKAIPALKKVLRDEDKWEIYEAARKAINQIKSKRKRR